MNVCLHAEMYDGSSVSVYRRKEENVYGVELWSKMYRLLEMTGLVPRPLLSFSLLPELSLEQEKDWEQN